MSNCTKAAKEDVKSWIAEDAAKEMADHGVTPEVVQEVLKLIKNADLDDKDGVHIRVITVKSEKNSKEDSKEEAAKEELRKAQDETKHEPAPEKKPEAGECTLDTLVAANARLSRALETSTGELSRVLGILSSVTKENVSLRTRLSEKS